MSIVKQCPGCVFCQSIKKIKYTPGKILELFFGDEGFKYDEDFWIDTPKSARIINYPIIALIGFWLAVAYGVWLKCH